MKFYSQVWQENRELCTLNRTKDKRFDIFRDSETETICFASHGKPQSTLSLDVDYRYTAELSSSELLYGLSLLTENEIMDGLKELRSPAWFKLLEDAHGTSDTALLNMANLIPSITKHLLEATKGSKVEKDGGENP